MADHTNADMLILEFVNVTKRSRRREVKERLDALTKYDIVRPSPQAVASCVGTRDVRSANRSSLNWVTYTGHLLVTV